MNLTDLAQGEPWMYPEERQTAAALVQSIHQSFTDRQIHETPFLILRVQDYLLHYTLCRRLERCLTPEPNASLPVADLAKLAEQIGKSRDRLRKSLKDLDDTAAKLAPPPPSSKTTAKPTPANPLHDFDFCQALIKEVGIDLNDPDFFSEEENIYDIPLEEREEYLKSRRNAGNTIPDPCLSETPADGPKPCEPANQPPAALPNQEGPIKKSLHSSPISPPAIAHAKSSHSPNPVSFPPIIFGFGNAPRTPL